MAEDKKNSLNMRFVRVLKNQVLGYLRRRNRWLCYFPPGDPTGIDLAHDLKLAVEGASPLVFDVGANVGQSIEMFTSLFPASRIHAFEPTPDCIQELRGKQFGENVAIHQIALGDREEVLSFNLYEDSVFNSVLNLNRGVENRFSHIQPTEKTLCATRTLDGMINELKVERIGLLKIDTQGYDLHVLRGAEAAFSSRIIDVVMIELNFITMYEGQDEYMEILAFLKKHCFKLVDFYEKWRNGKALAWCTALFVLDAGTAAK